MMRMMTWRNRSHLIVKVLPGSTLGVASSRRLFPCTGVVVYPVALTLAHLPRLGSQPLAGSHLERGRQLSCQSEGTDGIHRIVIIISSGFVDYVLLCFSKKIVLKM